MASLTTLKQLLNAKIVAQFPTSKIKVVVANGDLNLEFSSEFLVEICEILKHDPLLKFEMLLDVCGVDYLHYGKSEWQTSDATVSGFSRSVESEVSDVPQTAKHDARFAVVYHLLSLTNNQRIRLKTYALGETPTVSSLCSLWPSANWFEREAFDLFGINFESHPDLRRILTDYDFKGHPLRKDFPMHGHVERIYDKEKSEVVYQPVTISERVLVPKVIRDDSRYSE